MFVFHITSLTETLTKEHVMQAIKRVLTVTNGKIVLNLPRDFQSDRVEVIVLPYAREEKRSSDETDGDWREDFRFPVGIGQ
jgi:hypothetical protein